MAGPPGHFAPVARAEPGQPFAAPAVHHDAGLWCLIEDCVPALPGHEGGGAPLAEASGDVAIIGHVDAMQCGANAFTQRAQKRFGDGCNGLSGRLEAQS